MKSSKPPVDLRPAPPRRVITRRSANTLLLLVTDGNIAWDPSGNDFVWPESSALPSNRISMFRAEPLYADLRQAKTDQKLTLRNPEFLDAVADLSATVRGVSKGRVVCEDLRQHRILRRWAWGTALSLCFLAALASLSAYEASRQCDAAIARGLAANSQTLIDQRGVLMETAALLAVEAMRRPPWR